MLWTRFIVLLIFLCVLGWLWWWLYPAIQLVLAHPPKSGTLDTVILNFLSPSFQQQRPTGPTSPGTWVLLALIASLLLVMELEARLKKQGTYGMAGYATRRQARSFRVPRRTSRWMLRALTLPVSLASLAIQRAGAVPHNARLAHKTHASLFLIGKHRGNWIALKEKEQEEHVLLTASTGGGKSTLQIIPNLLREQGGRSLFIADLKNELYRITAGALARYHQIWWFTPTNPERSHGYNPLAYVTNAMEANMLADCWVRNTGESTDPFWTNCARYLICAIVLHLRATEPNAPFSRLADYVTNKSFEDLKSILTSSPSREARKKAATFLHNMSRNERLVGSIMTDIGNRFQLFDSENVCRVTAINEIDFQAMINDPTALFLSIPRSEVEIYRPLMACFTMQMFRAWEQRAAQSANGELARGVACYLDEFANIGYIPGYAQFVSTARYLRVALIMVIQNFSQLDACYGPQVAETIRANANTHLLLPGAGLRECQYYSERIGDTTIRTWTRSSRGGSSWFGTEDTWTQGEARRRLLTPDELRTLPARSVLMLRSTFPAMILRATPYYDDRRLTALANLPYHVSPLRREPPAALQEPPITGAPASSATVVDADQDNASSLSGIQQHILDDE